MLFSKPPFKIKRQNVVVVVVVAVVVFLGQFKTILFIVCSPQSKLTVPQWTLPSVELKTVYNLNSPK